MLSLVLISLLRGDPVALERALASVRPTNLRADVTFLASDELEGRDTPSQGLRLAARYLRSRLERLGFLEGGDNGYFDEYLLTSTTLDTSQSRLTFTRGGAPQVLVFGQDYYFRGGVQSQTWKGSLVAVGTGREEDFAGQDLAGRFAVVVSSREVRWPDRSRRAAAAGAVGLITLPGAEDTEPEWWLGQEAKSRSVEGSESRTSLPSLWLSRKAARELLGDQLEPRRGELGVVAEDHRVVGAEMRETLENVCGFWPGSDARLAKEVLVLSAHYDHVGVEDGVVYNGADDNASGTSGLLAVAEALASYGPMRRSVLLLWVSGEEKGLWGSAAWTKKPTLPEGFRAVANINIDMIGRNAPDKLLITPTRALKEYNGLARLAEALCGAEGFPALGSADEYWSRSDHMNFAVNLGIPVAFLFSDVHEDYHQPGDDAEKLDYDKVSRVVRLVLRMLDGLQADELAL
jgi:hypothetical protein